MDEQKYAPVIIPTLNRYEHLKRCLESLEKCTDANKTDVYVGLDFPPSDKYKEGWEKISVYLEKKEKDNGFKNLFVKKRKSNCGVGSVNSNLMLLINEIRTVTDRFIMTEDDNEFSPNFLSYCNWGLEYSKNDDRILAVCAYNLIKTPIRTSNNVYIYNKAFCAWGTAYYIERRERLNSLFDFNKIKQIVDSYPISIVFNQKVVLAASLLSMLKRKIILGDTVLQVIPEDKKWCVFPKVSKVRNWGLDGSGVHNGTEKSYQKQIKLPIDQDVFFEPHIEEELYTSDIAKTYKAEFKIHYRDWLRSIVRFVFYKLTGKIVLLDRPKCKK